LLKKRETKQDIEYIECGGYTSVTISVQITYILFTDTLSFILIYTVYFTCIHT